MGLDLGKGVFCAKKDTPDFSGVSHICESYVSKTRKFSHLRRVAIIFDIDVVFFYFAVKGSPAQAHHFG